MHFLFCPDRIELNFHNDRQNHRAPLGLAVQEFRQVIFDICLDGGPIADLLIQAAVQGALADPAQLLHQILRFLHIDKAAGYDIRSCDDNTAFAVQCDNHNQQAIL